MPAVLHRSIENASKPELQLYLAPRQGSEKPSQDALPSKALQLVCLMSTQTVE